MANKVIQWNDIKPLNQNRDSLPSLIVIIIFTQDESPGISKITKSVKMERPLIRVINNQKKQNWIKALHHHRQTLEQKRTLTVIAREPCDASAKIAN